MVRRRHPGGCFIDNFKSLRHASAARCVVRPVAAYFRLDPVSRSNDVLRTNLVRIFVPPAFGIWIQ